MSGWLGSPQWGSILDNLEAAEMIEKILEVISDNRLVASAQPEVRLTLVARRGPSGGKCLEATLSIVLSDDGPLGLEPSVLAGLAERLERLGLEVAGMRGVDEGVAMLLRVERRGDCD